MSVLRRHLVGDSDRDLALYLRERLRPRIAAAAQHERRESGLAVHGRAERLRLPVGVAVLLLGVVLARTVGYRFDDKILKVYVYDVLREDNVCGREIALAPILEPVERRGTRHVCAYRRIDAALLEDDGRLPGVALHDVAKADAVAAKTAAETTPAKGLLYVRHGHFPNDSTVRGIRASDNGLTVYSGNDVVKVLRMWTHYE